MSDLHERAARALGWSVRDAQSLSMQSLRDLVRPVDPDLVREMDLVIQSGAYARGAPAPRTTSIWKRRDWKVPGAREPFKYDWEHVRDATSENANKWLEIFRRDEPDAVFVVADKKPKAKRGPKVMKGPGATR